MKLYYEDGTVYEGHPMHSPRYGLVAISQPEARGIFRAALVDGPFFLFRADWGCWMECDLAGLFDQLSERVGDISYFRVGRYIRDDRFKAIWRQAIEDSDG